MTRLEVDSSADGAVTTLSLPGGLLDAATAAELESVANELVEDRQVRVVILRARTADFCTGMGSDLDPFVVDPVAALARLRPPVIAAITGRCESVGLELALCADLRVAPKDASFSFPDLAAGRLPCWGGTQRLARAVRPAQATATLLLGIKTAAPDAVTQGLLHEVSADDPLDTARAWAEQLLALGPLALEFAKEAVHRGSELPLRDGLRLEGELNHQLAASEDRDEGLRAFFDKRPPDFSGR